MKVPRFVVQGQAYLQSAHNPQYMALGNGHTSRLLLNYRRTVLPYKRMQQMPVALQLGDNATAAKTVQDDWVSQSYWRLPSLCKYGQCSESSVIREPQLPEHSRKQPWQASNLWLLFGSSRSGPTSEIWPGHNLVYLALMTKFPPATLAALCRCWMLFSLCVRVCVCMGACVCSFVSARVLLYFCTWDTLVLQLLCTAIFMVGEGLEWCLQFLKEDREGMQENVTVGVVKLGGFRGGEIVP